jgi:D-aminoacyl-tRNA deacylase
LNIKTIPLRAIIQRVSEASVTVDGKITGAINRGILLLVGVEDADDDDDIKKLSSKIVNMRIFNDDNGVMNLSIKDVGGELLVVSQFTLYADTKKGNRPSYIRASKAPVAIPMYEKMILALSNELGKPVQTGIFGADMKVALINDGPVTIFVDTR